MAWLQVHQSLRDHRKLLLAADSLDIDPPHMMGTLVDLWLWCIDNAPDGSLNGITPRMITRAALWHGDPEQYVDALIRAGWIDKNEDGTLKIHDWDEYVGNLIERRKAEKDRSQRRRDALRSTESSSDDQ